jgi:hypothetical protein
MTEGVPCRPVKEIIYFFRGIATVYRPDYFLYCFYYGTAFLPGYFCCLEGVVEDEGYAGQD